MDKKEAMLDEAEDKGSTKVNEARETEIIGVACNEVEDGAVANFPSFSVRCVELSSFHVCIDVGSRGRLNGCHLISSHLISTVCMYMCTCADHDLD